MPIASSTARRGDGQLSAAVRVESLTTKDMMIEAEPGKFFTEPHYNGYPAVLVRLVEVRVRELRHSLADAWR
jgi:hypothetical protein